MNDATVRFGYDGTALNAGLAQSEQRLRRFGSTAESQFRRTTAASEQMGRAMNKKPGMNGLGGVSMQLQDVMVQMQMGTKGAIILGQQGSQMLSAFGPLGALGGLMIALGAGLYTMGENAKTAFKTAQDRSNEFRKSLQLTLAEASVDNISPTLINISREIKATKEEMDKLETKSGMAGALIAEYVLGDKSAADKIRELRKMQAEYDQAYGQAIQSALEDGKKQVEIARLRLENETATADELELQLKHSRELARINASNVPEFAKVEMRSLADDRAQIAAEKLAKAAADLAENKKKELDQRKAGIAASREDLGLLELQASGRDRLVKKAERELQQRRRMEELIATGMDPRSAEDYVRRETSARDAIEKRRANGGRGPIGGVREKRMMESGIDQFRRNQLKMETFISDPSLPGYRRGQSVPQFNAFGIEPTSFQLRGRMMGGMTQPLTERAARVPGAPDLSRAVQASRPADVGSKIDHTNAILTRAFL